MSKVKRATFIIFIIAVPVISAVSTGCARRSRAGAIMDEAWAIMEPRPDSALTILNGIKPGELHGDEERARYALLMSMALE